MEIDFDNDEKNKKCFKCDKPIYNNLNVNLNAANRVTVLWNKFQTFIYKYLNFQTISNSIVPDFEIKSLISFSDYLMLVNFAGEIFTVSLNFSKELIINETPLDSNIIACSALDKNHAISLKYVSNKLYLRVYNKNSDFKLKKETTIVFDQTVALNSFEKETIFKSFPLNESYLSSVKKVFSIEDIYVDIDYSLVIISFDKITVYSCIFNADKTDNEMKMVKLCTCASEISDIAFTTSEDLNVVIGLTVGTYLVFNLEHLETPFITHLNTAIHKFLVKQDTMIYTDGGTLWKAEKILSKDIKLSQFFIKNIKDFALYENQIICTTFMDLIYTFSIDDDRSYIKTESVEEYCSAEHLLTDLDYLKQITDEVKKSEELVEKQKKERDYITALALSNRQDIMDEIINQQISVYESFEDAKTENNNVVLTNNISDYFDFNSFYFLIKITATADLKLGDILSNYCGDLRMHITMMSGGKHVKTTAIEVSNSLKKLTLLIPLQSKFIEMSDMKIELKFLTVMPGVYDKDKKIWAVLYRKMIRLGAEHFAKYKCNTNQSICLKVPKESLEELILQVAQKQYGHLFEFTDVTKQRPELKQWELYVKLPTQYGEVLNRCASKALSPQKFSFFFKQFSSDEFLNSKGSLPLSIGKDTVHIGIENDGFSTPSLKISSRNMGIALDMRNFLSNIIYSNFCDYGPGKEFIYHSFYFTVENLQKALKEYISNSSEKEIAPLIEQFERKVIGFIPI